MSRLNSKRAKVSAVIVGSVVGIAWGSAVAFAADSTSYEGPTTDFVREYKTDLDGFSKQYNKKTVHLIGASVENITLPDPKSGAPWLISLKDDTGSGSAANVSCFVSPSLSSADKQRALTVKKSAHIDVVAVVAADGYSLGLTQCRVVKPGLAMASSAAPKTGHSNAPANVAAAAPAARADSAITFVVTKAWNDSVNGVLFVHDAIAITGGANDVSLPPDSFGLSMHLANGASRVYPSMAQAAPTFQKISLMSGGQPATAYEVDPKDDLGALGTVTIPAHGSVRLVVTFQVTDIISDPNDNRAVSLR